ncbi:penicillin-binding protein 2 [Neptunicella sp.]|uniref:penicillin-binding protein 2 n=1 Tax=Neptunicella sp. TaxID=2125986 RepID=UPI003F68BE66
MASKRITIRDHTAEANLFARRSVIALLIIFIALGVLISNLYYLQVTRFEDYQTRSNGNRIKVLPVAPNRGLIYDRNGELLADNKPVFRLEVVPEQSADLQKVVSELTTLLNIDDDDIESFQKDLKGQRRFKPVALINNMTQEQVALFSVNQFKYPGISVEARLKRYYPYGDTLTHALGYVAKINKRDLQKLAESGQDANYAATYDIGKQGVEKFHETLLHGEVGYQEVEVNSQGRIIRTLKFQPPVPGTDIILNIDVKMQQVAQQALGENSGSVVVIDPRDGGVLALYSNPSYDPNLFVHGISSKDYNRLLNDPNRPLINRATQGQYPPASTVKPMLALAGLNEGVITDTSRVYDPGSYQLKNGPRTWRDWLPWGHGWVNVTKAIEVSCDTFFYDLAYKLGIDRISEAMNKFGFGEYTGIDLYEESDANMPSRGWKRARYNKPWYIGDTIPVGIGQGYWTATPLQLTLSVTTMVDHGHSYVPQIIRGYKNDDDDAMYPPKENMPFLVKDDKYWDTVLDAMYGVVNRVGGTGYKAFAKTHYVSAGKTGTAQLIGIAEDEKYDAEKIAAHLRDNAMYIGFAPYQNPELALTIVVENAGHGGSQAAPVARAVMDYYFPKPEDETDNATQHSQSR